MSDTQQDAMLDSVEGLSSRARALLQASGKPMTAENLNRAVMMVQQMSSAPVEFDLTGESVSGQRQVVPATGQVAATAAPTARSLATARGNAATSTNPANADIPLPPPPDPRTVAAPAPVAEQDMPAGGRLGNTSLSEILFPPGFTIPEIGAQVASGQDMPAGGALGNTSIVDLYNQLPGPRARAARTAQTNQATQSSEPAQQAANTGTPRPASMAQSPARAGLVPRLPPGPIGGFLGAETPGTEPLALQDGSTVSPETVARLTASDPPINPTNSPLDVIGGIPAGVRGVAGAAARLMTPRPQPPIMALPEGSTIPPAQNVTPPPTPPGAVRIDFPPAPPPTSGPPGGVNAIPIRPAPPPPMYGPPSSAAVPGMRPVAPDVPPVSAADAAALAQQLRLGSGAPGVPMPPRAGPQPLPPPPANPPRVAPPEAPPAPPPAPMGPLPSTSRVGIGRSAEQPAVVVDRGRAGGQLQRLLDEYNQPPAPQSLPARPTAATREGRPEPSATTTRSVDSVTGKPHNVGQYPTVSRSQAMAIYRDDAASATELYAAREALKDAKGSQAVGAFRRITARLKEMGVTLE